MGWEKEQPSLSLVCFNVTPPLLIVHSIVAFVFRNSGSCDCFGVLNCSNYSPPPLKKYIKKKQMCSVFYSLDLV